MILILWCRGVHILVMNELGLWWGVVMMFFRFEVLLEYPLGLVGSGPPLVWALPFVFDV